MSVTSPTRRCLRTSLRALVAALALTVAAGLAAPAASAADPNPVTPGDFAGFGFDQCLTPTQSAMNAWLEHSPFLAVGIYISGKSRFCRDQPNLTPTWVRKQLSKGWRLLPITLGPQADCLDRFPRWGDDPTIDPKPGRWNKYGGARKQGSTEARTAVAEATRLGIVAGSTLWYDLEGFDITNKHCRESALWFLHAWTKQIRKLGYVSGVYSSVGSGIKMLDDARVKRPGVFALPDAIWLARWDGVANTSSSYISEEGWRPGGRVKQYRGGHDERWGGVRINIDSNYLDLGNGRVAPPETRCGGVRVSFPRYQDIVPAARGTKQKNRPKVAALKCLLSEQGYYKGTFKAEYGPRLSTAVNAWKRDRGYALTRGWGARAWVTLLASGDTPVLKVGSTGPAVRRVQRALNAAGVGSRLTVNGVFDGFVDRTVRAYQTRNKLTVSGVVGRQTWRELQAGNR